MPPWLGDNYHAAYVYIAVAVLFQATPAQVGLWAMVADNPPHSGMGNGEEQVPIKDERRDPNQEKAEGIEIPIKDEDIEMINLRAIGNASQREQQEHPKTFLIAKGSAIPADPTIWSMWRLRKWRNVTSNQNGKQHY